MYNKTYISGLSVAGAISTLAWFMVVLKLDPFESTALALSLFFISLFFSLLCIFTLIGFYVRRFADKGELYHYHMSVSLRQGILLAVCADVSLFLLMLGLLTWW
ncbi:MAG: hypothetical protein U1D98_04930, partial [Candidatus Gracilibacteria bacterium]|nr:hypothetical protein [Candidatus Gracilibacteria bacterium]